MTFLGHLTSCRVRRDPFLNEFTVAESITHIPAVDNTFREENAVSNLNGICFSRVWLKVLWCN